MLTGYARVSTSDQTLASQLDALRASGCQRVFSEHESAAAASKRPELAACLTSLQPGDILVVTKLDRLARSMRDLTAIVGDLVERRVGFRCLHQSAIDTTSTTGRLMLNMLGAFAEFERELMLERQAEGIKRAKIAGKYVRPLDKPSMTLARQLRRQGLGAMAIANRVSAERGKPVSVRQIYRWTAGVSA